LIANALSHHFNAIEFQSQPVHRTTKIQPTPFGQGQLFIGTTKIWSHFLDKADCYLDKGGKF
jgi:hypothetical protein